MDKFFHRIMKDRELISVRYDSKTGAVWAYGNPKNCPCLTMSMFEDFYSVQKDVLDYLKANDMKPKNPINFFVYASQVPEVFGYGGELNELIQVIENKDRQKLERCAEYVIKTTYINVMNFWAPLQTIALIEGDTMGGGFQAALSYNTRIAEEQAKFGLQQTRFNLCPGIGIYSLLARAVGMNNADRIITSSKTYSAKEMQEMGAVTEVVPKGEGGKAIERYMKQYLRSFNVMQTLHAAKLRYAPFEYKELEDMAALWVDAMLRFDTAGLDRLKKIAEAQKQQLYGIFHRLRTKQDRRFDTSPKTFPIIDADGNVIEEDRRKNPDPRKKGQKDPAN